MTQEAGDDLQELRREMKSVTDEIITKVHERIEIAKRIGEIKRRLDLDVRDEKAAQEIRARVAMIAQEKGLRLDFAIQILNILLSQSELIQESNRIRPAKQTHLAIFSKAKEMERAGKKIIHMEVGEPDYDAPASAGTALFDAFSHKNYHYTDTAGIIKLRSAIAKKEGTEENEVIVTPGGRFAIFSAIVGLLKSGDEILIIEPAWPAYKECAQFTSITVNIIKTRLDRGWIPDMAEIEQNLTPNTKMIAINYPNNPTGVILSPQLLEEIVRLASKRGIYLLSDEVYSYYSRTPFKSLRSFQYEKTIVVQSFSKTYAMTGFRVGYALAKRSIIDSMRRIQALAVTSVAEPMQQAALATINENPKENARIMQARLEYICSRLEKMSLRFKTPDGAMYVFPELPENEDTPFIESLLQRGVAVAPGSGFGDSYAKFIRISACQPEQLLARGLDIMSDLLMNRKE